MISKKEPDKISRQNPTSSINKQTNKKIASAAQECCNLSV